MAGIALLSLPYTGSTGGLMIVGALISGGIAGVGFWAKAAIGRAERPARVLVTAATAADLVVVVLLSAADESVLPLLASFGLHAAVVVALCLPSDARRFFGEAALPAIENLHRQVLEMGKGAARPGPVGAPWPTAPAQPTPPPQPPAATRTARRPGRSRRATDRVGPAAGVGPSARPAPATRLGAAIGGVAVVVPGPASSPHTDPPGRPAERPPHAARPR